MHGEGIVQPGIFLLASPTGVKPVPARKVAYNLSSKAHAG
jgi:hypothetical protein